LGPLLDRERERNEQRIEGKKREVREGEQKWRGIGPKMVGWVRPS